MGQSEASLPSTATTMILSRVIREHVKMIFRAFGRVVLEFYQNDSGLFFFIVKIQIHCLNLNYLKI